MFDELIVNPYGGGSNNTWLYGLTAPVVVWTDRNHNYKLELRLYGVLCVNYRQCYNNNFLYGDSLFFFSISFLHSRSHELRIGSTLLSGNSLLWYPLAWIPGILLFLFGQHDFYNGYTISKCHQTNIGSYRLRWVYLWTTVIIFLFYFCVTFSGSMQEES